MANHTSYLDGWMLTWYLGGGWANYASPQYDGYNWTVAGCWSVFPTPVLSTLASLGRGLPIQGRFLSNGTDLRKTEHAFWVKQNPRFLENVHTVLTEYSENVLIFPEGRIFQVGLEKRDQEGRYVLSYPASDDLKNSQNPGENLGPFYWGVGRIVAKTGCQVVPVAHAGNDSVIPCSAIDRKIDFSNIKLTGKRVRVEVGKPLDFTDLLDAYRKKHGVVGSIEGESEAARALYADITRHVRKAVVDLQQKIDTSP